MAYAPGARYLAHMNGSPICRRFLRHPPTCTETNILFGTMPGSAMIGYTKHFSLNMPNAYLPIQRPSFSLVFVAAVVVAISALGCTEKRPVPIKADIPLSSTPSITPSSTVLGVEPAGATREPAATTSKDKTDMSKEQQSAAMPLPGQANDHSVLLPASSPQRAASR